jgi:hypothetical protein
MTSTVATLSVIAGKTVTAKPDLDAICKAMGIPDTVKQHLPAGPGCRYLLLLSSNGHIPDTCVDTAKAHMQLVQPATGASK